MSANDRREHDGTTAAPRTALAHIATLLGCSVEELESDVGGPLGVQGLSEIITIWGELEDHADRRRLLAFARKLTSSQ